MSNDVYDDVLISESRERNSEQVEMMVTIYESADCVRDQDFRTNTQQPLQQTGNGSLQTSTRASPVCLVLLCVLLLTAVIVLSFYIYTNYTQQTRITSLREERDQLLTRVKDSNAKKNQLENENQILKNEKKRLLSENDSLIKQRAQLQQEKNDLQKCLHELDGCVYYQSRFYFISSEKKNWSESRRYCTDRGADLIIINDEQEQNYFKKESGIAVWIGLTDSDEEGSWKWVDGSNMTTGFWSHGEPNGHIKENCAVSRLSGLADYPCHSTFQWICENITLKSL